MNDLQVCQFKMLKDFVRVCEKYNLTYFVSYGSCIGAVRHKGFIPWDDDIDVMMPREDYDKFLTLQKELDKNYFIQTFKTDPNYIYNYAKLRDSSTTFIENFFVNHEINHGVWLDIFPIDGMSYEEVPPHLFSARIKYNWLNTYLMYLPSLWHKVKRKTFFKDLFFNLVALIFSPFNLFHYRNRLMERRMKKIPYKDARMVGFLLDTATKIAAFPKEYFGQGVKAMFEGLEVTIPTEYDKILRIIYGDYMTPPPVPSQCSHHHNKGVDLDTDYKSYRLLHRI